METQRWEILATNPEVFVPAKSLHPYLSTESGGKFFLQGMMNRMGISYHKYGSFYDVFPHKRTGIDNVRQRVNEYVKTGNLEFLIDAANYCLIEFLTPSVEGAFFTATDSDKSPGVVNVDGSISHGKDEA